MLKYVSDKQIGGPMCMPQMTFPNVFIGLIYMTTAVPLVATMSIEPLEPTVS